MTRVLYLFLISIAYTNGQSEKKSSLTFVIDVTRSMESVRRQVEMRAHALFDAVMLTNESSIENFVLVTFADIDVVKTSVNNVTNTKNRDEFKDSLALTLVTGGNCPEYSLSGIETGIENSLPGSTIYVFTDAFAKDFKRYKHVSNKAQKKEIQVIFVLTGMCSIKKYGLEGYNVYTKLANDTSGQVFNLHRDSVVDILKYVQDSVVARRIFLAAKTFPSGDGHTLNYTSDYHTTDTTISVAGNNARINVKGPDDEELKTMDLVHLINVTVSKVNDITPSTHIVTIDCSTDCRVVVTARSDIRFRHGFSAFLPVSMKDTTVKPSKDDTTYLTINVMGNFLPQTVTLLDAFDNIIPGTSMPLKPLDLDNAQKLFVTAPFNTPIIMFRIVVTGLDLDNNATISRISTTLVEPQDPNIDEPTDREPTATIEGGPKITVEFDTTLQLKCTVNAFPKPNITWENHGTILETKVFNFDLPYDYVSIHKIEKVNENTTYICKSTNTKGEDVQSIIVEAKPEKVFQVVEEPKDITIGYAKICKIKCKINAYPPANITWFKNGEIITIEDGILISGDGSEMTVQHMQLINEGKYTCEVKNELKKKEIPFEIKISGVDAPVIDKIANILSFEEGQNVTLNCRIKIGTPKPTFQWYYKDMISDIFIEIEEARNDEELSLENIKKQEQGTYKCLASNEIGNDTMEINLIVEYAPTIDYDTKSMNVKAGDELTLTCPVHGVPKPVVKWTKDDMPLLGSKFTFTSDHQLIFYADLDDRGVYKCNASNKLGSDNKTIIVKVEKSPNVLINGSNSIDAEYNEPLNITCEVLGYPKPDIVWTNISSRTKLETNIEDKRPYHFISYLVLEKVTKNATYQCKASNTHGDDDMEVTVRTFRRPFFNVSESPEETYSVKYNDIIQFGCKVDAYPPAEVNWYKNGKSLSKDDLSVSSDGFKFTIKQMQPIDEGKYLCIANNSDVTYKYSFKVQLTGLEPPKIGVLSKTLPIPENANTNISCRIEKGTPKPSIQWYYNDMISDLFVEIEEAKDLENLLLEDIKRTDQGTYRCIATNIVGNDSMETNLIIECAPTIDNDSETVTVLSGDLVKLTCVAKGVPEPDIEWTKDGKPLIGSKLIPSGDHSLEFVFDLEARGIYKCSATNTLGTAIKTVNIEVGKPPTVVIGGGSKQRAYYDGRLQLECYVEGYPAPDIKWTDTTNFLALFGSTYIVKFPYKYVSILNIHKIQKNAVYQCKAENKHGDADDKTLVVIETKRKSYFKVIEPFDKTIAYNTDDQLYCKVDAYPPAKITWYKGSKLLTVKYGLKVYPDGGTAIQFKNIQPSQKGQYTCKASNSEKTENFIAMVAISGLELPEIFKTTSEKDGSLREIWAKKGATIELSCKILKGMPKPSIKWFRRNKYQFVEISEAKDYETYIVKNANKKTAGEYGCQANNTEGYASLKMNLKLETWRIRTRGLKKQTIFENKTLQLYCKCKGEPKSKIKWIFEGTIENPKNLPLSLDDADTHDLNIKDIQYDLRGRYTCVASNSYGGQISFTYEVDVYTAVQIHNKDGCTSNCIIRAIEGDRVLKIHCNATGYPRPRFKWTIDGFENPEESDTLMLYDVKKMYAPSSVICEARNYVNKFAIATYKVIVDDYASPDMSSDSKSTSIFPNVVPNLTFVNKHVKTSISLGLGEKVDLDCKVHGYPFHKVSWSHDDRLVSKSDVYRIKMKQSYVGKYKCEATNGIDKITRIYDVTLNECLLKIDPDAKKQPLILSHLAWPTYKYNDGYLYIPQKQSVTLVCQKSNKLKIFNSFYVYAYCNKTTQIEIEGKAYDYSDIQCTEEVEPRVKWTGKPCLGEDSETVKIFYELHSSSVESDLPDVYEICMNLLQDIPLYTKHKMILPFADSIPKKVAWFNDRFDFNFEKIYDHYGQIYGISSMMGRLWHKDDRCVFSKRQLVSPLDVFPGVPQSATFTYLNVVPHWSSCSTNNWDDVESRVRRLAESKDDKLTVWTGTAENLKLTNSYGTSVDIYISDQSDPRIPSLPVSTYLWKVVQNPSKRTSLAIIQLNIPDITLTEASDYIKCTDMCHRTIWMNGSRWQDINRGYVFCCELKDFESNFRYGGLKIFGDGMNDPLI